MTYIHPTALVETDNIGDDAYIGPYCYISNRVILGKNCKLVGFASIGMRGEHPHNPEDQMGIINIENDVEIREFVTISAPIFGPETKVGAHSYLMTKAHVGHDAFLGPYSVLSSCCIIGGHTLSGKYCYFGLNCTTHQRSELGDFCMIGANAFFKGNSPDGIIWGGVPATPLKVNTIGLDRHASLKEKNAIIKSASAFLRVQGIEELN